MLLIVEAGLARDGFLAPAGWQLIDPTVLTQRLAPAQLLV